MTVKELEKLLNKEAIDKRFYSLCFPYDHILDITVQCLHKEKDGWRYYILDRGDRYDEVVFSDEGKACGHFLKDAAACFPALKKYLTPPLGETA
jgi:hypothetical protein